ncbi:autotransporter strand-loop-strand O-heptosyltransferase [Paraburkholderia sp.]|uniref:autotransporter strand-loop-strand O-heptosyltransferase n=1 Tax=Paraburkholderia sp. TaxID=1926495 RepID=UPI0025FBE5CE|nr:autotransporter strand-loop-strand O-heptosyltransferase [Paraburkholderia sp.]
MITPAQILIDSPAAMPRAARASAQPGGYAASFTRSDIPALMGREGVRYDFNHGCRVQVPVAGWRVRMRDLDTNSIVYDETLGAGEIAASRRKYFVRFQFDVFDGARLVFSHAYDATWRHVMIEIGSGALGDAIAWMPSVEAFRQQHECTVTVRLKPGLRALFEEGYPALQFVDSAAGEAELEGENFYASYRLNCFLPYADRDLQPTDVRVSSRQDFASYMLGVPAIERRPNVVVASSERTIRERYVCIATQASAQCQYWNNPRGWTALVAHLRACGYRVLCIDRDREYGVPGALNKMPAGVEDFTGERPLQERASLLSHADFFIGLGSGLSWLAWAVRTPVVLISGYAHPKSEFSTPWRVINFNACNSCYNDTTVEFDRADFNWCPRHADEESGRYQCTSAITPEHVMRVIDPLVVTGLR